jgi:hypothetical protein
MEKSPLFSVFSMFFLFFNANNRGSSVKGAHEGTLASTSRLHKDLACLAGNFLALAAPVPRKSADASSRLLFVTFIWRILLLPFYGRRRPVAGESSELLTVRDFSVTHN